MFGAAGFEPADPRPPGTHEAKRSDMVTDNVTTSDTTTRKRTHQGPREAQAVGQATSIRSETQALVRALARALIYGVGSGDMGIAWEALGTLLDKQDSGTNGTLRRSDGTRPSGVRVVRGGRRS